MPRTKTFYPVKIGPFRVAPIHREWLRERAGPWGEAEFIRLLMEQEMDRELQSGNQRRKMTERLEAAVKRDEEEIARSGSEFEEGEG